MHEQMKMFCLNFEQNRIIKEEFDLWGVKVVGGVRVVLRVLEKPHTEGFRCGIPNPHRKFHHSISIRKCMKIGGTDLTFGGLKVLQEG